VCGAEKKWRCTGDFRSFVDSGDVGDVGDVVGGTGSPCAGTVVRKQLDQEATSELGFAGAITIKWGFGATSCFTFSHPPPT
jgi:hypothetical protein